MCRSLRKQRWLATVYVNVAVTSIHKAGAVALTCMATRVNSPCFATKSTHVCNKSSCHPGQEKLSVSLLLHLPLLC